MLPRLAPTITITAAFALTALWGADAWACSCSPAGQIRYPADGATDVPMNARIRGNARVPGLEGPELVVRYADGAHETITGTIAVVAAPPQHTWTFTPTEPWTPGRPVYVELRDSFFDGLLASGTFTATATEDHDAPAAPDLSAFRVIRDRFETTYGTPTTCDAIQVDAALLRFEPGALTSDAGDLNELWLYSTPGAPPEHPFAADVTSLALLSGSCADPEPCSGVPYVQGALAEAETLCMRARRTDAAGNPSELGPEHCVTVEEVGRTYDFSTHTCGDAQVPRIIIEDTGRCTAAPGPDGFGLLVAVGLFVLARRRR